jgi:hypothetical protein
MVSATNLIDLPKEIRHRIYKILFGQPDKLIWPSSKTVTDIPGLSPVQNGNKHQTALFLVSRQLHDDAVAYLYSVREISIRDRFDTFGGLGNVALASLRRLEIDPPLWLDMSTSEAGMWQALSTSCPNLELLTVWVLGHVLCGLVQQLSAVQLRISQCPNPPAISLELGEWERYLSYESETDEYDKGRKQLLGISSRNDDGRTWIAAQRQQQRLKRLPLHVRKIVFVSVIPSGTSRALDEFFESHPSQPLVVRSAQPAALHEDRGVGISQISRYDMRLRHT